MLLILACLFASASAGKYCCNPDQWEGDVGLVIGRHTANGSSFTEGMIKMSVDNTNQMVSEMQQLVVDGVQMDQQLVLDYGKKMAYITNQQGCSRSSITTPLTKCIPDDAVESMQHSVYGLGDNSVDTLGYSLRVPGNEIYISVTADTCVPVSEVALGMDGDDKSFSSLTYANIKAGIADMSVFNVPASCMTGPILPSLPGLGKRGLM